MINLRYHIVSLTAVFLAIGIGLAFGSTFLDQATVDNLQGQLDGLRDRLDDRDDRISELEDELDASRREDEMLDTQGAVLLDEAASGVPVVVLAGDGAEEETVTALIDALATAGADMVGTWWVTDRFVLDDDAETSDLAEATGSSSTRAATLRRRAIATLSRLVIDQQAIEPDQGATDDADPGDPGSGDPDPGDPGSGDPDPGDPGSGDPDPGDTTADEGAGGATDGSAEVGSGASGDLVIGADAGSADARAIAELFARGFLEFDPMPGRSEVPVIPGGVRFVVVGGSESVPDEVVLLPVVGALADGPDGTSLVVATSAAPEEDVISTLVATIRGDEDLRERVSTVETSDHFSGRAAIVMTVAELGTGAVGHFGLAEGSARLLPERSEP